MLTDAKPQSSDSRDAVTTPVPWKRSPTTTASMGASIRRSSRRHRPLSARDLRPVVPHGVAAQCRAVRQPRSREGRPPRCFRARSTSGHRGQADDGDYAGGRGLSWSASTSCGSARNFDASTSSCRAITTKAYDQGEFRTPSGSRTMPCRRQCWGGAAGGSIETGGAEDLLYRLQHGNDPAGRDVGRRAWRKLREAMSAPSSTSSFILDLFERARVLVQSPLLLGISATTSTATASDSPIWPARKAGRRGGLSQRRRCSTGRR